MTYQASEQNFNTVVIGGGQAGLVEAKSGSYPTHRILPEGQGS